MELLFLLIITFIYRFLYRKYYMNVIFIYILIIKKNTFTDRCRIHTDFNRNNNKIKVFLKETCNF